MKKRALHPSSIREPNLDFRKLLDKLEQAEITIKLEETENLTVQLVNNIQTTTSQINKINDSDTELSEKHTEILKIYEKNTIYKGKPSFKKWCNYFRRYGHSITKCSKNNKITKINHKNIENQKKSLYQFMKKDQNLPTKIFIVIIVQENHFQISQNYSRQQSPYNTNYRGRSPDQRNSRNFSQNR